MAYKKNKAIENGVTYLRDKIKKGDWKIGQRIPSCRSLSQSVGISVVSLLRGLEVLKKEKLICIRDRSGIYVGNTIPKPTIPIKQHRLKRWEQVLVLLKRDILEGRFHTNETLPSLKELTVLYNVSNAVMYKSLNSLIEERLICSDKRGYRINRYRNTASEKTIYFFAIEYALTISLFGSVRTGLETFVRTLENECRLRNIRLEKNVLTLTGEIKGNLQEVFGFIIYHLWLVPQENIVPLIKKLLVYNRPVVLFNGLSMFPDSLVPEIKDLVLKYPLLYVISVYDNNHQQGVLAGHFLLSKGYRKVHYFSPKITSQEQWSQERYEGLHSAFADSGHDNGVVFHEAEATPDTLVCGLELLPKHYQDTARMIEKARQLIPNNGHSNQFDKRFQIEAMELTVCFNYLKIFLREFKKAALLTKDKTVWVCADDYIANYAALEYLKDRYIAIPAQIGLMGFNDQDESLFNNVTSVNFNISGLAMRAINFISHPKDSEWKKERKKTPIVFGEPEIIDRGSV